MTNTKTMKQFLKFEYLLLLIFFGSLVYSNSNFSLWILLIFWYPDISFVGYLFNSKIGAFCYNFFHYYGLGVGLFAIGNLLKIELVTYLGLIQLAHVSFDRLLGYGLKYPDNFNNTHLGMIGEKS